MKNKILIFIFIFIVATIIISMPVNAQEEQVTKYFTYYCNNIKYEMMVQGYKDIVVYHNAQGISKEITKSYYQSISDSKFDFYTLDATGNNAYIVRPRIIKTYTLENGVYKIKNDYTTEHNRPEYMETIQYYVGCYPDFTNSDITILQCSLQENIKKDDNTYMEKTYDINTNMISYLKNGVFISYGENYLFRKYDDVLKMVVGSIHFNGGDSIQKNSDIELVNFKYDNEKGTVTWDGFVVDEQEVIFKGVKCIISYQDYYLRMSNYYNVLDFSATYKINLGNIERYGYENIKCLIYFQPYYVTKDGCVYVGKPTNLSNVTNDSAIYTNKGVSLLSTIKKNSGLDGIVPDKSGQSESEQCYSTLTEESPFGNMDMTNSCNYYDDYKLIGFTSDYKINAKWKSVQYPDAFKNVNDNGYIKQNESVYIRFSYANKKYPTQVAYTKWLPIGVDPNELRYSFKVENYYPLDDNYYLFCVSFMPYLEYKLKPSMMNPTELILKGYGSENKIYFNPDNSEKQISTDTGNINNSHNTDNIITSGGTVSMGDFESSFSTFGSMLENVSSVATKVATAIATFFSFLPTWVIAGIGASIVACIILRFIGR